MPTSRLHWLQIVTYEQFEPVRIEFSTRENLLLGINGAGKTQLLKLIHAVLTLDFSGLMERSFEVRFEMASDTLADGSEMVFSGSVKNERAIEQPDGGDSPAPTGLTATIHCHSATVDLQVEAKEQEFAYRLVDPPVAEVVMRKIVGTVRPAPRDVKKSGLRRILNAIDVALQANYFAESDDQARTLTEGMAITFVPPLRYLLTGEGATMSSHRDVSPLLFGLVRRASEQAFRAGIDLTSLLPDEAAELSALLQPLGVSAVHVFPNVVGTQGAEIECRGITLKATFHGGATLADSKLTFGQRRYLYAGIVSLFHLPVPVLVDEIDNGMHPRLVATLLDLWRERQLFLVSHNKMVIDYTSFAGADDVREKIHVVQRDSEGRQRVSALAMDTAREIYEKIDVAIQSPSDVLRSEGIW